MEVVKYFVVMADYTDTWNDPDPYYSLAQDNDTNSGCAIYDNIEDAQKREAQILDHATIIKEMSREQVQEILDYYGTVNDLMWKDEIEETVGIILKHRSL